MRIPSFGSPLLLSIVSLGLTACGTVKTGSTLVGPVIPAPAQSPPTTLTGNWFLAGSRVPATYPVVSTFLYVQGNIVTGEAAFSYQCKSTGILVGSSNARLAITGTIANDGTFQASTGTIGDPALGTTSLSLTGNSPLSATPSVWAGTYSLVSTSGSSGLHCAIAESGGFAATPIAPFTGAYIGLPANTGTPFGPGSVVSLQIMQGTPTLVTQGSTTRYLIPLTANLTVANSLCPFTGSTTGASELSSISGDSFGLVLTPGTPYGFLSGTLTDPTANSFSGDLTSLANANGCPGIALYNFTRK